METYGSLNKDLILYHDMLYVKGTYLTGPCQVPPQKLTGLADANKNKKTIYGRHIGSGDDVWFEYDHLPPKIRESRSLPARSSLIETIKKSKPWPDDGDNPLYQIEMALLGIALDNSEMFIAEFREYKLPRDRIAGYCRSYAVFNLLAQFKHLKIYEKYNLYHAVLDPGFSFHSNSVGHFYAKYNDIAKFGIVRSLTHKGVSNQNAVKVTKIHEDLVGHFYRDRKKLSRRDILHRVNTALKLKNLEPISLATVKRILSDTYSKNLDDMARNGDTWAKNTILPFLIRSAPENPGDHFQVDATRLQVFCKDGNREGAFLWIAVVIDGYSRQVMGFAIADKESPNLYARALKSAFSRTNWLPAEILRDNYLGYTQDNELSDLIGQTQNLGVAWRAHQVGNPRDKGIVESFNNVFNTIFCKDIPGFVGEGIKSRNINARPDPKILTWMRKNKRFKNMDEVIVSVTESIHRYNREGTKNGKEPPLEKFNMAPPKNVISLCRESEPLIYHKKKTLKLSRSTICLNMNGCAHFYHVPGADLVLGLHGTVVQVRYDPGDMLSISLFSEPESRFLCHLQKKDPVPLAKVNQTIEDQSNLYSYFQQNRQLIEQLQQKIEERQSAIDALDLPPHVLEPGFSGNVEACTYPREGPVDIHYHKTIQLPGDDMLKTNKVFFKYKTVYSEIQELLYKQKGTAKKI